MRKFLWILYGLFFLSFAAFGQKPLFAYELKICLTNSPKQIVEVYKADSIEYAPIIFQIDKADTCLILKGTNTEESIFIIRFTEKGAGYSLSILDEKVSLLIDIQKCETTKKMNENIIIQGSDRAKRHNKWLNERTPNIMKCVGMKKEMDELIINGLDSTSISERKKEYNTCRYESFKQAKNLVLNEESAFIAIEGYYLAQATMRIVPELNLEKELDEIVNIMEKKFPSSNLVKLVVKDYKNQANYLVSQKNKIGEIAPTFTLFDKQNKKVSLTDFKGKYVLLDVWASWCKPCREEHPNLRKVYGKFHNPNFVMVSVSLDKESDRNKWLDAIEKDGVGQWIHLIDTNVWQSELVKKYDIQAIPSNFLINPQGKIIAAGLRGNALLAELTQIFKKD